MKVRNQQLQRFIEGFLLENKEGIICFDAVVVFTTVKEHIQVRTEVQVINLTATGLDVVYLLSPDVSRKNIPDAIAGHALFM